MAQPKKHANPSARQQAYLERRRQRLLEIERSDWLQVEKLVGLLAEEYHFYDFFGESNGSEPDVKRVVRALKKLALQVPSLSEGSRAMIDDLGGAED